jgi:hypothetical protein
MHTRRAAGTALLALAALTAGCSSGGEPKTIRVTVTQTVTAQPSTQAATSATDGILKMGAKKDIVEAENNLHVTVQALAYQQPYKGPQPQKPEAFQGGDIWATASIKVCNVQGVDITVSSFPWSLTYGDDTSIKASSLSGGDMPKPEFPAEKTLKPGRCAAGLIAFPVPSAKKPARLVYEPDGSDPTEWAIS